MPDKKPSTSIKRSDGKQLTIDQAAEPRHNVPLDKLKVKELLVKHYGNVTAVSRALGCCRKSVQRMCNDDPEVKEILAEARERVVDEIEDVFLDTCRQGGTTETIFFLKTRGRHRGYDQDMKMSGDAMRAALDWALNKSKNPAEDNS